MLSGIVPEERGGALDKNAFGTEKWGKSNVLEAVSKNIASWVFEHCIQEKLFFVAAGRRECIQVLFLFRFFGSMKCDSMYQCIINQYQTTIKHMKFHVKATTAEPDRIQW